MKRKSEDMDLNQTPAANEETSAPAEDSAPVTAIDENMPADGAQAADTADTAGADPAEGEGEHHHHHHHKHHSKAWHRRRRMRRKMRKNRKGCLIIALCLLGIVSLVLVSAGVMYSSMIGAVDGGDDTPVTPNDGILRIVVEKPASPALTVHECVAEYMNAPSTTTAASVISAFGRRNIRSDYGYSVTISLSVVNLSGRVTVSRVSAIVSEHPDFSDPVVYQIDMAEQLKLQLRALKSGTTYYVKVVALLSDQTELVDQSTTFTTAALPRILSFDRLYNVRDIGGWSYGDGDRVLRQDRLIRGSELDGFMMNKYYVTPEGVSDLLTILNIRTELDLRAPEEYIKDLNMLGKNVSHVHINGPVFEEDFTDEDRAAIRDIFTVLADESNYPIYIHDVEGVEKTGLIVGVLEAYLGVQEGDILREYELSAFSGMSVSRSYMSRVLANIKTCRGTSMREKTAAFLTECGLTGDQLAALDRIYLGE